jgi:hydroxypyruvate isomerase
LYSGLAAEQTTKKNVPQFAANLNLLFTELPFVECFATAKAAGFVAAE